MDKKSEIRILDGIEHHDSEIDGGFEILYVDKWKIWFVCKWYFGASDWSIYKHWLFLGNLSINYDFFE